MIINNKFAMRLPLIGSGVSALEEAFAAAVARKKRFLPKPSL